MHYWQLMLHRSQLRLNSQFLSFCWLPEPIDYSRADAQAVSDFILCNVVGFQSIIAESRPGPVSEGCQCTARRDGSRCRRVGLPVFSARSVRAAVCPHGGKPSSCSSHIWSAQQHSTLKLQQSHLVDLCTTLEVYELLAACMVLSLNNSKLRWSATCDAIVASGSCMLSCLTL